VSKEHRGMGQVYQPIYSDRKTGEKRRYKTWWLYYYVHGKLHRESAGTSNRNEAVRMLKSRLADVAQGKPVGTALERTTFDHLAEMLINDYRANSRRSLKRIAGKDGDAKSGALKHLRDFLQDHRAIDITTDRITAYVAYRQQQEAAPATINRELSALKRAFRLAVRAGKASATPYIAKLQENNVRKGFFERDQFEAVLRELPDYLRAAMEVAYITGWRVAAEILTRQKHHLDLEHGFLRLDPGETKNGQGRTFPIGAIPRLREVLSAQVGRTKEFELATDQIVFWLFHRNGQQIKDFRSSWKTACERAGVPGRIPHDFRRTAVRNLERAGVPRSAAMAMVGHQTESIYRRYAIADEVVLREAAQKLAVLDETESQRSPRKVVILGQNRERPK
jgi:integrase